MKSNVFSLDILECRFGQYHVHLCLDLRPGGVYKM